MKAVIQRVSRASVVVDGEVVGRIGVGLFVLLGIERGDDDAAARRTAAKIVGLRCFADDAGRMSRDAAAVGGGVLLVSQFTLAADLSRKGRRPSFDNAATPEEAERLYGLVARTIADAQIPVETGVFRAHMTCEIVNDGPVTFHYSTSTSQR